MKKHWKMNMVVAGRPVAIYTTTTDELLQRDLENGDESLLADWRKHQHFDEPTQATDHFGFASAILIGSHGGVERTYDDPVEVDTIPDGLQGRGYGTHLGVSFLTTIYEQPS